MESSETRSHQNYELLIRLDEQMKGLSRDFRDVSSGFDRRLAIVEASKMSREESAKLFLEEDRRHDDHEKRLRAVEKSTEELLTKLKTWGTVAVLALSIFQLILRFI